MPELDVLQRKYQAVIDLAQERGASLKNIHIENDKLLIRAAVPTEQIKNQLWDKIKQIDSSFGDLTADFAVDSSLSVPETQYEVAAGDTLSKIAKRFYGDANQYMKIFNANKDQLSDPNEIQVGQTLVIPQ